MNLLKTTLTSIAVSGLLISGAAFANGLEILATPAISSAISVQTGSNGFMKFNSSANTPHFMAATDSSNTAYTFSSSNMPELILVKYNNIPYGFSTTGIVSPGIQHGIIFDMHNYCSGAEQGRCIQVGPKQAIVMSGA